MLTALGQCREAHASGCLVAANESFTPDLSSRNTDSSVVKSALNRQIAVRLRRQVAVAKEQRHCGYGVRKNVGLRCYGRNARFLPAPHRGIIKSRLGAAELEREGRRSTLAHSCTTTRGPSEGATWKNSRQRRIGRTTTRVAKDIQTYRQLAHTCRHRRAQTWHCTRRADQLTADRS